MLAKVAGAAMWEHSLLAKGPARFVQIAMPAEAPNPRHKKTGSNGRFFSISPVEGSTLQLNMVPRGRLELPLLSKTDFESAASTNSAIRACWARSIERLRPLVNNVSWPDLQKFAKLFSPM